MSGCETKRKLIVPVERTHYMEMIARQKQQNRQLRIQSAVILLLILSSLIYVIGNMALTEKRQKSSDDVILEMEQDLKEQRAITADLEERISLLKEENEDLKKQAEKAKYPLTSAQRQLVAGVVTAEAETQGYTGQVLVAQCIRNAAEIYGLSVDEVVEQFDYAAPKEASENALQAVSDVFDSGYGYTDKPILYFYAPAVVESEWHEGQQLAVEYKDHRFFTRNA